MKSIHPFALLAAPLLAALILCGCWGAGNDARVAGGDDIPNDVEPLGKKAAQAREDSADWNGFKGMPRSGPGLYDTTTVPDTIPDTAGSGQAQPKSAALAKRSGGLPPLSGPLVPVDTLVTRVDTAKGTVEAVHTQVKDSILKVDSTLFVPADPAHPGAPQGVLQVAGKITFADTSLWKAYSFKDADGDGFLAPRAGSRNLADLDVSVKLPTGIVERTVQRVAAGPDLDFNARGDNRLLGSTLVRTLGPDTLDVITLLDADGDSLILDLAKDTNLVDLIELHRYPGDDLKVSMTLKARLVAFSADSSRNYAVRFERITNLKAGGTLGETARGAAADSSFRPGTEASWNETLALPAGDSLALRARSYTVRLPEAPGAFQRNLLLALMQEERYRGTFLESFSFGLTPESPVPDGRWPAGGAVNASLLRRDGVTVSFEGQAVVSGMEGAATVSPGSPFPIAFDRNGAVTRR